MSAYDFLANRINCELNVKTLYQALIKSFDLGILKMQDFLHLSIKRNADKYGKRLYNILKNKGGLSYYEVQNILCSFLKESNQNMNFKKTNRIGEAYFSCLYQKLQEDNQFFVSNKSSYFKDGYKTIETKVKGFCRAENSFNSAIFFFNIHYLSALDLDNVTNKKTLSKHSSCIIEEIKSLDNIYDAENVRLEFKKKILSFYIDLELSFLKLFDLNI
ncbi:hypothetical protein [Seonamhaeicola sp. ML3]|uniref:hypothetical protein n=1 Tax=Seonamhaeicola sp. ML3 TaxID=2937786 RepID=UPI00200DD97E|nr:hypothetical protein [Seonamhaeicola sp. ML3]